ncbi:MAG: hypothetical protein GH145_00345 [Firmicutes bacterium]|nr:hypothetical protein [Bacillota bacterium]
MFTQTNKFEGVIPAMLTPLTKEKKINFEATEKLVDFLLTKGVNGLFILGTFGEGLLLSVEEGQKFIKKVTGYVNKRVPVIVFSSHMEVEKTKELIKIAQDSRADAAALVPPFYYHLSNKAIEEYFRKIFREFSNFSFFIYNIPQCTINEVNLSILQNLAEACPNFVGLKNSKASLLNFQSFLPLQDRISLFMGEDPLDFPALLLGAKGIVSGPAGVFPEPYINLYQACIYKNYEEAKKQQVIINDFLTKVQKTLGLGKENYLGKMLSFYKKALEVRGIKVGTVKEPLPELNLSEEDATIHLVEEFLASQES